MTYNIIFDVPAPIEMYDAMHAAVREVVGEEDVGMVAHIARATDAGFEIVENPREIEGSPRQLQSGVMAQSRGNRTRR